MIQDFHGIVSVEMFRVSYSFVSFNEAVFDTLGQGWLQITISLGNKAYSMISIFREN